MGKHRGSEMKIGFYLKWPRGASGSRGCNVIGDELFAEAMCRVLSTIESVESAKIFAPNQLPREKPDVMIYLNDTLPHPEWAGKHVLYMQNAYGEGSDTLLEKFHEAHYDGYAFISNKLLEIHKKEGFPGIFLPFGVDNSFFYPRKMNDEYKFDVAYVGNDIKGETRSSRFLLPAQDFNFGLFGNWQNPQPSLKRRLMFWKPHEKIPAYKQEFFRLSKGKIPQEDVPVLYSSAKINLNCTHQDCIDWDVITLRTFEVLACRGFLITDKVPVAEKTMQGCMVFTEGDKDLKDKIRYYLENETERLKIAQKGYEYTTRFATLDMRMKELVSYLESIL
jgi:spore maturation protein CgeB